MTGGTKAKASADRVSSAHHALKNLTEVEFRAVLWNRLRGRNNSLLPALGKEESPSSLFTDVAENFPDSPVTDRLRKECTNILRTFVDRKLDNSAALGELCYLAAATDSTESIPFLTSLIERPESSRVILPDGQSLVVFALRCLLGLLPSAGDTVRTQEFHRFLEGLLISQATQTFALTALAGLWPEQTAEYVRRVPGTDVGHVRAALRMAGFDPQNLAAR